MGTRLAGAFATLTAQLFGLLRATVLHKAWQDLLWKKLSNTKKDCVRTTQRYYRKSVSLNALHFTFLKIHTILIVIHYS